MRHLKFIIFVLYFLFDKGMLFGQGSAAAEVVLCLHELSLFDIEPQSQEIKLELEEPTESGEPLTLGAGAENDSYWLNYTSAIAPNTSFKNIYVQVVSGEIPPGLGILVRALPPQGSGAGTLGFATPAVVLSAVAQPIVVGIGSSYTGDGAGNGHNLIYTLFIEDYSELELDITNNIQVLFTITD